MMTTLPKDGDMYRSTSEYSILIRFVEYLFICHYVFLNASSIKINSIFED